MKSLPLLLLALLPLPAQTVSNSSPLEVKARYLQHDLIEKHLLQGLYVSIVPVRAPGVKLAHTVDEPGNVIHAGVWTGRYLAGVGYQYAVTKDPEVRKHGGEILAGLRRLQEVTGKPGLLARGYVKGHGPVIGFERGGGDSVHWHQGQGRFADYRFYSDVSVDNFNAVLFGYAIYYDLAADAAQRAMIAHDVDRLMTHLLDNHYRIIDLNGEVTQYGHVGMDPDPARDEYYEKVYAHTRARYSAGPEWRPALRASLMALPDLLIAYHVTGKPRYIEEYRKVIARFGDNPEPARDTRPYSLERVARVNHSSEGQAYEALFHLMAYEKDPKLLAEIPAVDGRSLGNELDGRQLALHLHDTGVREDALAWQGIAGTRERDAAAVSGGPRAAAGDELDSHGHGGQSVSRSRQAETGGQADSDRRASARQRVCLEGQSIPDGRMAAAGHHGAGVFLRRSRRWHGSAIRPAAFI